MCLKCNIGNLLKMYVEKREPSVNEHFRCVCKALLLPKIVHEHRQTSDCRKHKNNSKTNMTSFNLFQKQHVTENMTLDFTWGFTWGLCLGEKKEFVLSLLSIPHVISLKASRLAPCLRNTKEKNSFTEWILNCNSHKYFYSAHVTQNHL